MTEEEHSTLGGSGVERYRHCPGSVALSKLIGHEPDAALPEWTLDGLLAHATIENCLKGDMDLWQLPPDLLEGITPEIARGATIAIDYMSTRPGRHFIELSIGHPAFHPLMYSRLDFAAVSLRGNGEPGLVEITDYKNGAGVRVEARGNLQTRYYGFAFLDGQKWPAMLPRAPDDCDVKLTILQPNVYDEPQYEILTAGELRAWAYNELRPMMVATERDQYLNVGPHCRFCPARVICPAGHGLVKSFAGEVVDEIAHMSNERLFELFSKIEAAKIFISALGAEVVRRNLSGNTVLGTKMVEGRANRVWNRGAEEAARDELGDRAFELELRSPAQMITEFGSRGKSFASKWGYKPAGKPVIALANDPRPALNITTPADKLRKMLQESVDAMD